MPEPGSSASLVAAAAASTFAANSARPDPRTASTARGSRVTSSAGTRSVFAAAGSSTFCGATTCTASVSAASARLLRLARCRRAHQIERIHRRRRERCARQSPTPACAGCSAPRRARSRPARRRTAARPPRPPAASTTSPRRARRRCDPQSGHTDPARAAPRSDQAQPPATPGTVQPHISAASTGSAASRHHCIIERRLCLVFGCSIGQLGVHFSHRALRSTGGDRHHPHVLDIQQRFRSPLHRRIVCRRGLRTGQHLHIVSGQQLGRADLRPIRGSICR